MFHVNAWGMPYAGVATGAKQAFLAGPLDPRSLVDILFEEEVTVAAGVPTVWLAVADELALRGSRPPALRHIVVGGASRPGRSSSATALNSTSRSCRPGG